MSKFRLIFKTIKKPIIGMVHFLPLLGYDEFKSLEEVEKNALEDLKALIVGGIDGVMFENNYDIPHKIKVGPETVASFTAILSRIKKIISVPFGVSVLWNDAYAALSIAKVCGGSFIRIPVFVDEVETSYGKVKGEADKVLEFRRKIKAEDIALLVDVHVKHAKILSKLSLEDSAVLAIKKGADAIILTGKWTSDAPEIKDVIKVRKKIGNFPLLIGSGVNLDNIEDFIKIADGIIVGTSLKKGSNDKGEINVKSFKKRVDVEKVKLFISKVKKLRNHLK